MKDKTRQQTAILRFMREFKSHAQWAKKPTKVNINIRSINWTAPFGKPTVTIAYRVGDNGPIETTQMPLDVDVVIPVPASAQEIDRMLQHMETMFAVEKCITAKRNLRRKRVTRAK